MQTILLVFFGGGIGSLFRYGVGRFCITFLQGNFPVATFVSNLLSCILLGVAFAAFPDRTEPSAWRNFLVIGICGGFSTFSTFSFETLELMRSGHFLVALANILISITVCITIIWLITKQA